eukprot:CAMPEP_0176157114 /NCGR_PEP_ID=MMETSP0120_2-20121206/80320_1 /TAXON_ID=160619 /ORGANISM="Kryptoperidinium foliaceum, Strain CCMP 1326" /LENGTH=48 /DNA_ID= /DNA_START= /DNA_END= /DNA_ORIENTATION=
MQLSRRRVGPCVRRRLHCGRGCGREGLRLVRAIARAPWGAPSPELADG